MWTPCFLYLVISNVIGTLGGHIHDSTDHALREEGHSILKRFSETDQHFVTHDIADVFHEIETETFHRVSKRDLSGLVDGENVKRIRLDLGSGNSLHLKLRKRSLIDDDTQFYENWKDGVVRVKSPSPDCYATGEMQTEKSSVGFASVALCDGLHGTAIGNGVEYYIHPAGRVHGEHRVHVLSRPAVDEVGGSLRDGRNYASERNEAVYKRDTIHAMDKSREIYKRSVVTSETYLTATDVVIEMGVFVDQQYYGRVHHSVPGREKEYLLIGLAGVQALYSDKDKVGYNLRFKIKRFTLWVVNPDGYNFVERLQKNLFTFCSYTKGRYSYDMHFLYSGVTKEGNGAAGKGILGGVCKNGANCVTVKTISMQFALMAHEIGHNLGFQHTGNANCPDDLKKGGGFMYGSNIGFSKCNKWELQDLFKNGGGQCLFEETEKTLTSDKYINLPDVYPGQISSPDDQCKVYVGPQYQFYRPFDLSGNRECRMLMCINLHKGSPEYLKVVKMSAQVGFPCGDEMVCRYGTRCIRWGTYSLALNVEHLRQLKEEPSWSPWPDKWSECSRKCGTGIRVQRRRCNIKPGVFLAPYCRGSSIKAQLCNQDPCPGELATTDIDSIRQVRGDEVCKRFHDNNVTLPIPKNDGAKYLPSSMTAKMTDGTDRFYQTRSCMLMCMPDPFSWGYLHAIYPDGTPCTDADTSNLPQNSSNIEFRCLQGVCTAMTDCPDQDKDKCGICGGDKRCVTKSIDSNFPISSNTRKIVAEIPAGASKINVEMTNGYLTNAKLELWNSHGVKIFGDGDEDHAVEFDGAMWSYDGNAYIRAKGTTRQRLYVKVVRSDSKVDKVEVTYFLEKEVQEERAPVISIGF